MASSHPVLRPLSSFRIGGDGHYSEFHELDPDHMPDDLDLFDMLGGGAHHHPRRIRR
ncbi:hypothetical protein [Zoogloea sp.]|uniref:hypothetical protein n=1 Tax=Zoogloea sp. TaxID=49181 RepID=UPI0035AF5752